MRLFLFAFTLTGLVYSCSNNNPSSPSNPPVVATQPAIPEISEVFLSLFPEINYDDLHIFSPPGDAPTHGAKFEGKQIDRSFYKILAFEKDSSPFEVDTGYHFFACYKFKLSNDQTGLIIRRPSQYDESAVNLYIWDNAAKKITDEINLADAFGDEGWHFVQDAWIKDVNNDNHLDIVCRKKDYDEDIEDPTNITRSDTSFVYLGDGKTFKPADFKIDRKKFQLKYWSEK